MSRPQVYPEDRVYTGLRIPSDLHERVKEAAKERGFSANHLMSRAIEDYLGRLIPVDELRLTRDPEAPR